MTYTEVRDPKRPWGYWLRSVDRDGAGVVVDEDGREWASVRDAFWRGRLGMPSAVRADEQMDGILAVLDAIAAGHGAAAPPRAMTPVVAMLAAQSLVATQPGTTAMLTHEGHAIRAMLRFTLPASRP